MTIKANGRSALILATGLFVCFVAGPSQAAAGADNATASSKPENAAGAPIALNKYAKHASHHSKTYARRKSSQEAEKSSSDKQAADTAADDSDNSSASSPISPSVANADAALASPDSPTGNAAKAMTARANDILQNAPANPADSQAAAETQVVSADQLNDVDRALHEAAPPPAPTTLAMASAEAPTAPAPPPAMASSESSTWDQTSLIGKIFIGFGALLTMASAARMFMA
jgi:hypothetical protein